jgi:hypothetical protein
MIFIPETNRMKSVQGNSRNIVGKGIDPENAHRMLRSDDNEWGWGVYPAVHDG